MIIYKYYIAGCLYSGASESVYLEKCLYFDEWNDRVTDWNSAQSKCNDLTPGGRLAQFDMDDDDVEGELLDLFPALGGMLAENKILV